LYDDSNEESIDTENTNSVGESFEYWLFGINTTFTCDLHIVYPLLFDYEGGVYMLMEFHDYESDDDDLQ